jgi:redox-sensitive bicupin YhaK (pirin superfamily)
MTRPSFALLEPHTKELGGFQVRRLLPGAKLRAVGPFVFFDHIGPATFPPGGGVDVRPHPHIGLATVTYLFEGALMHRDSLGSVQRIAPGDVNWMTAGSGIVHSERSPEGERPAGPRLHGIQTWVALPLAHEKTQPEFSHHPGATLPVIERPGVSMRLVAGNAFGQRAPARAYSEMFYLAVEMAPGASFELPPEHEERGAYLIEGAARLGDESIPVHHLAVLAPGSTGVIHAAAPSRLMLLGGARLDGDRTIWWNFVASSKELIEQAKLRWSEGRFPPVPGETEFIPLPP